MTLFTTGARVYVLTTAAPHRTRTLYITPLEEFPDG
jgi:hypothetical protein